MTSGTSNDDITVVVTARLAKRKRKRNKAYALYKALRSEFDAFSRKVVKRVRGLEARLRETDARVEVAETQRDAMCAELDEMRRTLEESKVRCGPSSLSLVEISEHILRSDFLPEPGDLGRLRALSKGMRDAVDATGCEIKKLTDDDAEKLGYVSLLKDRHSRGVLKNECLVCAATARNGDLEELKALRADGCPWGWQTYANAAKGGHLTVLEWARQNGCPWDAYTCSHAAEGGHLDILKWARENGAPWDAYTCSGAAYFGHFEVLKWARENGCPWNKYACEGAAGDGNLEVLQWLRANGCPWDLESCLKMADGHTDVAKWILGPEDHSVSLSDAMLGPESDSLSDASTT